MAGGYDGLMTPVTLDYREPSTVAPAASAAFRRERLVYGVGVVVACALETALFLSWPHTSNSLDPEKAELYAAMHVVGGAAAAWLVVGVRRLVNSPLGRRSVAMWLLTVVNLVPAAFALPGGYQ